MGVGVKADIQAGAINETRATAAKTDILYGDSGLGKTTALIHAAKWFYKTYRKPVRLISAEDSSKVAFDPWIAAGVVEAAFITHSRDPLTAFRNLSLGQWHDGKRWQPYQPGSVSAYLIEGLTSISELLATHVVESGYLGGEQKANNFSVGEHKFGRLSLMGYGFVQDEMLRNVRAFAAIPDIESVIWTAHEVKATDSDAQQIRGPALMGSAKTNSVRKYCGMLLHLDGATVDVDTEDKKGKITKTTRKMWFENHPDPQFATIHYPSKMNLEPTQKAQFAKRFPNGFIVPTLESGIEQLLQARYELINAATADAVAFKKSIDSLQTPLGSGQTPSVS